MEGSVEMMSDSIVERGQSEPPPIAGCVDLLSEAAAQNVNKSHVGQLPEESPTTYFNEHHCGNILKVLKQQQNKAELCDTVLIANNKHIAVHSCVIAANSPYFKALFDTSNFDRMPGQPLQISLPATSPEVVDNLIGYMYSGDISITTSCVEELLQLTDKFMMDDVRQCCELHMIKSLDLTNWSSSQVLAKAHAFQDLANEIIKYLTQNLMIVKNCTEFAGLLSTDVGQILNQSNISEGSDLELCKLEFLLNWLSYDYPANMVHFDELLSCIKPYLLTTEGVNKVFNELPRKELYDHELTKRLRSQIEELERIKEEDKANKLAEEEAKRAAEEEEEIKAKADEELKKSAEEELKKAEEASKTNDTSQTEHLVTKESIVDEIDRETIDVEDSMKVEHADSDTEIEDNGDNDREEKVKTEGNVKASEDNEKSPSLVDTDGNQYLEDGTLIIQPESAWHGRGKRKSYRPKKIHSGTGRPRGRPRKNFSTSVGRLPDDGDTSTDVAPPPRRRGRPPVNRSQVLKKIRTRPFGSRIKTSSKDLDDTKVKGEAEEVADDGDADVDDAELLHDLELPDTEDTDPSWNPVASDTNSDDLKVLKVTGKRGRKRKGMVMVGPPIMKEYKKRGRKPNPGDKTYYCDKCPRSFKALGALSHHMKGHGSETPMLCEICGFSTRHYGSMNVHRRKHAGKVMHCPIEGCNHTEVHRARLDDHVSAVHHGVKRHMCSICGKSFGAKKHLQRHEGLHGRAKDIACNLCNYTTNRTDKLREHIRRHHPVVAVDMGMMKAEDLNKISPLKPRTPKVPKEPKQPRKKKGTRYDIHAYSEVEIAAEELEKKEGEETVAVQDVMVTNQSVVPSPGQREPLPVQHHTNQPVMVQMSHAHAMPSNMAPVTIGHNTISHNTPIGVSNIPSHLLGTTTLSEEMIQYLASYTADQIHMHNPNQGPPPPNGAIAVPMEHQPPNQQQAPLPHHAHHPQHHPPWTGSY